MDASACTIPTCCSSTAAGGAWRSSSRSPAKSPSEREKILAGYAADPRIDRVVYVVYKPQVAQALCRSVSRLGISSLVAIHVVRQPDPPAA